MAYQQLLIIYAKSLRILFLNTVDNILKRVWAHFYLADS